MVPAIKLFKYRGIPMLYVLCNCIGTGLGNRCFFKLH